MAKYRVVGARPVEGVKPGDVLSIPDDSPLNVLALVAAGHLEVIVGEDAPEPVTPKGGGVVRPRPKDGDK